MTRRAALVLVLFSLAASACGRDMLGPPKRPGRDGFRAHAAVKQDGKSLEEFELAARGGLRRKEAGTKVVLWDGGAKASTLLDLAARTAAPRPFASIDEILPGHPLTPGFSEKEEAKRRNVESYHRESDVVLAGHVCWLWRFEDRPDEPGSPSTTYWVAPDLDRLVLRVEREVPGPAGATVATTELTNVRIGAEEGLFRVPQGFAGIR